MGMGTGTWYSSSSERDKGWFGQASELRHWPLDGEDWQGMVLPSELLSWSPTHPCPCAFCTSFTPRETVSVNRFQQPLLTEPQKKHSEPSEEVRIDVGVVGGLHSGKRDFWLVAHRGETAERVKYHFKEEVKARACESIRRRTIYAQARAQFDMGIMKKRRSLWMT